MELERAAKIAAAEHDQYVDAAVRRYANSHGILIRMLLIVLRLSASDFSFLGTPGATITSLPVLIFDYD